MSNTNNKDVLVLGGDGFIGHALSRILLKKGYRVHVVSRRLKVEHQTTDNLTRYRGDLGDSTCLKKLLPICGTIVHLAAATTPGVFTDTPSREVELNIQPTLAFLDLLGGFSPKHLIFVSSGGTLYGNPPDLPASEDMPLQPLSYHGAGKLTLETFLGTFAHLTSHNVTIVRPANVYGPGQDYQSGFGVIRTILEHLRKGTEMVIWGDGSAIRDFLYIDDMVRALELLIQNGYRRSVYNVGSGRGYSLNEVITIIESVCGRNLPVHYQSKRGVDVQKIYLDASRLAGDFGWKPMISLEKGVLQTWNWLCP